MTGPLKIKTSACAIALLSCAAALVVAATPGTARAEEPGISATGKGITGGALLGAELTMAIEAAAGVHNRWLYLAGGLGGAAAGGAGGYFVEQGGDPKPSYYLLAAGMALVIPTTVAVLQANAYQPPAEYVEDRSGPSIEPAGTKPAAPAAPAGKTSRAAPMPLSLVDVTGGAFRVGVPAVTVFPTYTPTEVRKYGVEQHAEVRVPVFEAAF